MSELLYSLTIPVENQDGSINDITYKIPSNSTEPYTELVKLPKRRIKHQISEGVYTTINSPAQFLIYARQLLPEHEYEIRLYSQQKNKNATRKWRHPGQTPQYIPAHTDENGETVPKKLKRGHTLGYINLANRKEQFTHSDESTEYVQFPEIPEFMEIDNKLEPGVLQTEWDIGSGHTEYTLALGLEDWLKPLCAPQALDLVENINPEQLSWSYGYVQTKNNDIKYIAPKFFKFCLYDRTIGKTYSCINILIIRKVLYVFDIESQAHIFNNIEYKVTNG